MHWNSYKVQDWHRNERFLRRNPSFAAYLLRSQCSKSLGHLYLQTRFLCDLLKETILTVFPTCYPSSPCAPSGLPSQTMSLLKDWPAYGLSFQRHILISDLQKIIIQRMKLICFPSKRTLFPEIKGQIGCPDYVCSGYLSTPATYLYLLQRVIYQLELKFCPTVAVPKHSSWKLLGFLDRGKGTRGLWVRMAVAMCLALNYLSQQAGPFVQLHASTLCPGLKS